MHDASGFFCILLHSILLIDVKSFNKMYSILEFFPTPTPSTAPLRSNCILLVFLVLSNTHISRKNWVHFFWRGGGGPSY